MKVLIINGPNLNLLGEREPEQYGNKTLIDILDKCADFSENNGIELQTFQSNHEGEIIDKIHNSKGSIDYLIINPGALTHYSYSIHDAIKATEIKTIEVHISNIYQREEFRKKSVTADACIGQISGFGYKVYKIALKACLELKGAENGK